MYLHTYGYNLSINVIMLQRAKKKKKQINSIDEEKSKHHRLMQIKSETSGLCINLSSHLTRK